MICLSTTPSLANSKGSLKSKKIYIFIWIKNDVCCSCVFAGRPVMIVVEYMENGSLDSFLRVSAQHITPL